MYRCRFLVLKNRTPKMKVEEGVGEGLPGHAGGKI